MKILICTIFVLFYAICVASHGIRVKRGLSSDEQKNFLTALNADRQMLGKKSQVFIFENLTYDVALEKIAESFNCDSEKDGFNRAPLQISNETLNMIRYANIENHGNDSEYVDLSQAFFNPKQTKIGCSKSVQCSTKIPRKDSTGKKNPVEIAGKTSKWAGLCVLGPNKETMDRRTLVQFDLYGKPEVSKYGDLLGVAVPVDDPVSEEDEEETTKYAESSSASFGRIGVSLTVFFGILVFYF